MDKLEIRAELDVLRTMVAMLYARGLPDDAAARDWTQAITDQREAAELPLRDKYRRAGHDEQDIDRVMVATERAYDALLGTVRDCVASRPGA